MKHLLLILSCGLLLLCSLGGACDGDAPGGASDSDSDADADCGEVDQPCCESGDKCDSDLLCVSDFDDDPVCMEPCEPTECDYGDDDGYCLGLREVAVCVLLDGKMHTSGACEDDLTAPCETQYDESENTICVPYDNDGYCLEKCDLDDDCEPLTHRCVPLDSTGQQGACFKHPN